jgi:hypothetical protein
MKYYLYNATFKTYKPNPYSYSGALIALENLNKRKGGFYEIHTEAQKNGASNPAPAINVTPWVEYLSATKAEYNLVKQCPDGSLVTISLRDEKDLQDHLTAMWKCTQGYKIISIFKV